MSTVWITRDEASPKDGRLSDGDYVMRAASGGVEIGKVHTAEGEFPRIEWLGNVDADALPAPPAAAGDVDLAPAEPQDAFLTAARGFETAVRDRGA